jgi:hypothetical protein
VCRFDIKRVNAYFRNFAKDSESVLKLYLAKEISWSADWSLEHLWRRHVSELFLEKKSQALPQSQFFRSAPFQKGLRGMKAQCCVSNAARWMCVVWQFMASELHTIGTPSILARLLSKEKLIRQRSPINRNTWLCIPIVWGWYGLERRAILELVFLWDCVRRYKKDYKHIH